MVVLIEIYQSDGTTLIESFTNTIGDISDEEMLFSGLSFDKNAMGGMGSFTIPLRKTETTISANVGNIVKIKNDGTVVYVGQIESRNNNFDDEQNYVDKVTLTGGNPIDRASDLHYTLKEDDGTVVSTNIQTIYTDSLPSLSIDTSYNGDSTVSAVREIIDMARGAINLTTNEDYIYYMKSDFSWHTKKREDNTSPLGTFDIGTLPFFIDSSVDVDAYQRPVTENNIINKVIINDTVISSSFYSSQISTSRSTYGIRELLINNPDIAMSQTSNWMDGWILKYLNPTTTYNFTLSKETYGMTPWFPTDPDGYVKLTKDSGGSTVTNSPLQSIRYTLDSGGWNTEVTIGDIRPIIDTKRLILRQTVAPQPDPDTTPPSVQYIASPPSSFEKTYKSANANFYLAARAKDDNGINSVQFYVAKYNTVGDVWGSYTLIGSGTFISGDATNEGFYRFVDDLGYEDLSASPYNYVRGDIFRIKTVATDPSGNIGEDVKEFQLEDKPPEIYVSVLDAAAESYAPSTINVEASTGFSLKVAYNDLTTVLPPSINYEGPSPGWGFSIQYPVDSTEQYFLLTGLPSPPKGEFWTLTVTITNTFGVETQSVHYIKGIEPHALGQPVTVKDPDITADDTTATIPQFKDEIEFITQFREDFYKVSAATVKFKIYNNAGTLQKTLTSLTTPAVTEDTDGGTKLGIFRVTTNMTELALASPGIYGVSAEITKTSDFTPEDGTPRTPQSFTNEGEQTQFHYVTSTTGVRLNTNESTLSNHSSRLPDAEKKIENASDATNYVDFDDAGGYWKLSDDVVTDIKLGRELYDTATHRIWKDTSSGNWKCVDSRGTSTLAAAGNPTGTTSDDFKVDSDDSSSASSITFGNTAGGTAEAKIEFTGTVLRARPATDASWVNLATQNTESIEATLSNGLYRLQVNDSTDTLSYIKDPDGTPVTYFEIDDDGTFKMYNDILPQTGNSYDIGDSTDGIKDIYVDGSVYTDDIGDALSNWNITWDAVNSQAIPENIVLGFMDG
jgi:hypothetical protein